MRQLAWCVARPGGSRSYLLLLLVLAVLVGVVAMHGLAPAVPSTPVSDGRHAVTAAPLSHAGAVECEDCVHVGHDESGGAGGHTEHADPTCAAGGTSGAPPLPALALASVVAPPPADVLAVVPAATFGGRAPPSLSELQLLRI